jgi:predicted Zn-dependent protease
MKRALATLLWVMLSQAAGARVPQLLDEPQGLAWSPSEVSSATHSATDAVLRRARERHALGCLAHCPRLARVWHRLLPVFDAQQARWRLHFDLRLVTVRLPDVEAFSAPDGRIVLSEDFIAAHHLDDAQLAFVLAHEATHVLLQHERLTLTSALSLLPHQVPRTVADMYAEFGFNLGLLIDLQPAMQQVELQADEAGLELAALAGYAPAQQLRFMRGLARAEAHGEPLAATHPPAVERLRRLQGLLPLARRLYRQHQSPLE